jgi:uncharacterized cofD-like protein
MYMPTMAKQKVVCFGGGTGMPSLLSGLKRNPWLEVTAIVTTFDNGGSSGTLRDMFGVLPPGDVLKCLLALAEDEPAARKILLTRIKHDAQPNHTGGNLLLYAFEKVYGNYDDAISALGQILSIKGRVIPVTQEKSMLCAQFDDESTACGETSVDERMRIGKRVTKVFLDPPTTASVMAIDAIRQADVLVAGPGSLYTSVLPNFLPIGITDALLETKAPLFFVSNLLTEGAGMAGMSVLDVVHVFEAVAGRNVDLILANSHLPPGFDLASYATESKQPLICNGSNDPRLVAAQLWTEPAIARHDSMRLAELVFSLVGRPEGD